MKRGRGRPKGSKNRKKEAENYSEFDIKKIFMTLVSSKNREEINRKLNKNKFIQNKGSKK